MSERTYWYAHVASSESESESIYRLGEYLGPLLSRKALLADLLTLLNIIEWNRDKKKAVLKGVEREQVGTMTPLSQLITNHEYPSAGAGVSINGHPTHTLKFFLKKDKKNCELSLNESNSNHLKNNLSLTNSIQYCIEGSHE